MDTCLARVDQMDEEKLVAMKNAGCVMVSYGVESETRTSLDKENKHQSIDRVRKIFALHHKHKVPVVALIIIGHPHEDEAALKDTHDLIAEIRPTWTLCQFMSPYPGTALHYSGIAEREGHGPHLEVEGLRPPDNPIFVPRDLTPEKMLEWRDRIRSLNPPEPQVVFNGVDLDLPLQVPGAPPGPRADEGLLNPNGRSQAPTFRFRLRSAGARRPI